jgi:integrase
MSNRKSVPSYRRHKPTDRAVVTLPDGRGGRKDFYLGAYGSAESRREYTRRVAEWETGGQRLPVNDPVARDLTINEVILRYWQWAQKRYVKNGSATGEQDAIKMALRFVRELYGDTVAADFGPLRLKSVRDAMQKHKIVRKLKMRNPVTGETKEIEKVVREGIARRTINKQISRIKGMFKWCVAEELVPPSVYQALACVTGFRKGESGVRETAPIRPVHESVISVTLPYLPAIVADMVRLQRLTGARSGEIVQLRAFDIDRTGDVWEFRPKRHKTEHHDRERIIFFGPQAQAIITKYLALDLNAPLFRPEESEAARSVERRKNRKTPLWPSHLQMQEQKKNRRRRRVLHQAYDVATYRRAIVRACVKAGVPAWTPHRLRHAAATEIRRQFGLEAAQAVLGHAGLGVTQVYAEKDMEAAKRIMAKIG